MTEMAEVAAILRLPAELVQHILRYIGPLDLASVALTCKALYDQSLDDQIWQSLINGNLPKPVADSAPPKKSFREIFTAHYGHWFLPRHRIWFADSEPSGKLLVARYDPHIGSIKAYTVVATRGSHTLQFWEKDREVIIHSFNPQISLDLNRPVLRLNLDSPAPEDYQDNYPSDRGYGPPSRYSKEILMETFAEAGLYSSFMLCRKLPDVAISEGTKVWPPLRFPADARTRNETLDSYKSVGHRPTALSEVSQHNFRLRKWVEYTGRGATPKLMPFSSPNGLSAAVGINGPYFASGLSSSRAGGMSIRMPEDITTYATVPEWCYTPTTEKPWQGIWCGDYSGHGCEFIMIHQPDRDDEKPLPQGMEWLSNWFRGRRRGSESSSGSYVSAQENLDNGEAARERAGTSELYEEGGESAESAKNGSAAGSSHYVTDYKDAPTGRLEALKLTGDPNIPRGEYTFIAPDIGHGGFERIADEEIFRGARVVRSAGHIAGRGFREGESD